MAEESVAKVRAGENAEGEKEKGAAYGMLARYANPELLEREKEGFALAIKEKYNLLKN